MKDGIWRYRWSTRFGRHTVYFKVENGIIQTNPVHLSNPVKEFEGLSIDDFSQARLMQDWRFHDDSLYQVTADLEQQP